MEDAPYKGTGQSAKNTTNYVIPVPILLEKSHRQSALLVLLIGKLANVFSIKISKDLQILINRWLLLAQLPLVLQPHPAGVIQALWGFTCHLLLQTVPVLAVPPTAGQEEKTHKVGYNPWESWCKHWREGMFAGEGRKDGMFSGIFSQRETGF